MYYVVIFCRIWRSITSLKGRGASITGFAILGHSADLRNIRKRLKVACSVTSTRGISGGNGIATNGGLSIGFRNGTFCRVNPKDCGGIR